MAGGGVAALKEHVEANQASMEASVHKLETALHQIELKNDQLEAKMEAKMDQMQVNLNQQFSWLKSKFEPTGGPSLIESPAPDPKQKGLLPTPMGVNVREGINHSSPVITGITVNQWGIKILRITSKVPGMNFLFSMERMMYWIGYSSVSVFSSLMIPLRNIDCHV